MSDEDEQKKGRSRISVRIGEVQVELEGTYDNIKKLMDKELFDFAKGLQETKKQLPSSTGITPETAPKAPEITPAVAPKEKTVPPPSKPSTTSGALSQPSRVSTIGKTTEKKGQRKIFSKAMVIALGLICIILAAGLVGAIAVYMPMVSNLESQIAEKNSTISSLNSQISSLNSQVSTLQADIEQINSTIEDYKAAQAAFNSEVEYYLSIIYLNESGYLFASRSFTQTANTSDAIYTGNIMYAGCISVSVESSSNTTYLQVVYSSYGVNYNQNVTVGTGGSAVFPVLPGDITVVIGNTELVDEVTGTASATYRY
jgi:outer membrane murein-binding lipoprotein Lpp